MKKAGIKTAVFGISVNFFMFLLKLYVSISSNSLSIYCDAVNNLADTFSCIVALFGFIFMLKASERKSSRAQALCTFVISAVLAVTGLYFAYNGAERIMYPVAVSYSRRYAILIFMTVFVKGAMGCVYASVNKKYPSPVFKTLVSDSVLDCIVTLAALIGFSLTVKINFALDGYMCIIIGIAVSINSFKVCINQAKSLIND